MLVKQLCALNLKHPWSMKAPQPILLLWILFFSSLISFAQNSCDCTTALNAIIKKTEDNYAGFYDKVNPKTRPRYEALVDSLRTAATQLEGDKNCFKLLKQYKKFFGDGHFQLYFNAPEVNIAVQKIDIDESSAKIYLAKNTSQLHPLEGIWEIADGSYQVALMRHPQHPTKIVAVVLSSQNKQWQLGMIKFEAQAQGNSPYKGIYWAGDLSSSERTFFLDNNLLNIPNSGYWIRRYPQEATPLELAKSHAAEEDFSLKSLDNQTFYIRIPSFGVSYAMVDSLLKIHDLTIRRSPYLIIDIRENGGGMNSSFPAILKYLNTHNFKDIHSHFRSTADNLLAEKAIIDKALKEEWISEKEAKPWQETLAKNQKQIGKMVKYAPENIKFKEVLPNPKKVAVLINEHCYSSAEYFVYFAKQSKKVTLFGKNTGGMMDYGNVRNMPLPCSLFELRLPTTRTGWVDYAPIDNVGFQPDVRIPDNEKDWVKFVQNYWTLSN